MNCERFTKQEGNHNIYKRACQIHLHTTGRTIRRASKRTLFNIDTSIGGFGISVDPKLKLKVNGILQKCSAKSHYQPTIQETNDLAALGFTSFTYLMDMTENEIDHVLAAPGEDKVKQRLQNKIKQIRREIKDVNALSLFDEGVPLCALSNWQLKVLDDIAHDTWKNLDAESPEDIKRQIACEIGKRESYGGPCKSVSYRREIRVYPGSKDCKHKFIKQERVNLYKDGEDECEGIEDASHEYLEANTENSSM